MKKIRVEMELPDEVWRKCTVRAAEAGLTFEEMLKRFAESLGGVESLLTYPMKQTHADVPVEVREALGVDEKLLRMSVGIENIDDLLADLVQAFA